jgi:hypothetical protein
LIRQNGKLSVTDLDVRWRHCRRGDGFRGLCRCRILLADRIDLQQGFCQGAKQTGDGTSSALDHSGTSVESYDAADLEVRLLRHR